MQKPKKDGGFFQKNSLYLVLPLVTLLPVLLFRNHLYGVFGESNYLVIHLVFEILIIVASLTIAIQTWLIMPFVLSNQRLYLGASFLFIGILEILHALSYKGMPYFIAESSSYSATWFYIMARMTLALSLLIVLTSKPKIVPLAQRWIAYSLACLMAVVCMFIVYHPNHLLPNLVVDGVGPTVLKNGMQYLAIILQFILVLYLWKTFNVSRSHNKMVMIASVYLILGDLMFTTYHSVYDIFNFIGHIFQLLGFYFLIRALYYIAVEDPFTALIKTKMELEESVQSLTETQKKLEKSEEVLHYMAYHDELTELPNSRFFREKLTNELMSYETKKAIMIIKINRLKAINESIGFTFGDLLLKKVATRLRNSLSSEIFLGKRKGGEFAIILPSVENQQDIIRLCKQLEEVMKNPVQVQHLQLTIPLNIGIALYPDHGENEVELVKHAQVALRESKQTTERYLFYHSEMESHLEERLVLEQDLHNAIEKGEFFLEYQPQVDVSTGRIHSVEALIRWEHPTKGWISPVTFIPIAEETGLIVPIGEWILETACKQVKQWHSEGIEEISVAVNLSIRQFFQQNLVNMVEDILVKTNLSSQYLELEITESMTMDTHHAIEILNDLKQLGIKIAVDDFGTGYSSMSYLKYFPIDCLKIDRSFVRNVQSNPHDGALISMIISVAKHLGLKVVAEGVEEVEQLAFLAERDCDTIQGYLFSKPISASEITSNFFEIQKKALSITRSEEFVLER